MILVVSDSQGSSDAGVRRRRVLAAHAELFRELLERDEDRLSKLANVVEALGRSGGADIIDPFRAAADHVSGSIRLEGDRCRVEIWWECQDLAELLKSAVGRATDVLIVIQGFPVKFPAESGEVDQLVLLDGHDLTLLLEGRWMLGQAVRFKQAQQDAHGRFINLLIAPPADLPDRVDVGSKPEEGEILRSNVDEVLSADDDESSSRVDISDLWDVRPTGSRGSVTTGTTTTTSDEATVPSNVDEHGTSVADAEAFEESEDRRLRRMRLGIAATVVLAILMVIGVVRGSKDATEVSLSQAADTAVRASRLEFDAYHTLDTGELRSVFSEMLAQQIEASVQELRRRGAYLDGDLQQEVLGSNVEGQVVRVAVGERGTLRLRSRSDGSMADPNPMAVERVIGYELNKQSGDRWRVVARGQMQPR